MDKYITYIDDFTTWQKSFTYSVPITVRFSETDMFGHVNNVSAFIYFEEARIAFLKHKGLFHNDMQYDTVPVVADLQCNYMAQIFFGETIHMYVKVQSVGNSSIDIHYKAVKENGDICLIGRGKLVNMDSKTGKSVPLTEEARKTLL